MNRAEFERMRDLEDSHFWFRARRLQLRPWLECALATVPCGPWLDVGVGTGRNLGFFAELSSSRRVIGIDQSAVALSHCRAHGAAADLMRASGGELPLAANSVALITALDVLEHLDDDTAAVTEAARCLCPRGELIVTVPAHPRLFSAHDRALGHRKRYRRGEMERMLQREGFDIVDSRGFNGLLMPLIVIHRMAGAMRFQEVSQPSDVRALPPFLNGLFGTILALESSLPRRIGAFSGLSWWVRARVRR